MGKLSRVRGRSLIGQMGLKVAKKEEEQVRDSKQRGKRSCMQCMVRLMVSYRVTRRWRMRRILGTARDLSFRLMSYPKLVDGPETEESVEGKPLLAFRYCWRGVSMKYVFKQHLWIVGIRSK